MSTEKAKDKVERVAGAARARMGDMTRQERSRAEQVGRQEEARGGRPGERVQESDQDVSGRSFTS
ncbi:general stress protein CsbD [Micromonospora sp. DR5-3]|uniref:general stress protein CsbD n=1 Tax=unclassified Micromonospora TaxID=2617518 RepID=UPI0011D81283|nr:MULTISPECIES: general stress protein CsbD [unclassified Micromonospora]MCW3820742.1 general stress protein CsbD [Micromonospora sp. DR5-3]TYC20268.1 general stress protein CsbD [Micromonospora sp. MP36]